MIDLKKSFEEGRILLINKPMHWTSFDAVKKIRNLIRIKKVGHAGTLDPLATGLLIICTGKFTKRINEFMAEEKEYAGSFTLGATTPTFDLESEPGNFKPFNFLTIEEIEKARLSFIGELLQVPPIHSAIKVDGKRVYELARKGEEIILEPRKVIISEFEIVNIDLPIITFRVVCGKGTYIRSLANDFGATLGCGAYLSRLCRTRIGNQLLQNAITLEEFMHEVSPQKEKG
ncbi:MAG: tRNA pseudouridine(55) synthase TruB [Chitinophagaceae bacterium]|nr:MAG: tRNA pseudouridine(55) synthase TruB [Chitinophagaceae bacterium]